MIDIESNSEFDHVVLVDPDDNPLGVEAKLRAHENGGTLHRAFSIFILNADNEVLLQRRALSKYHCAGLWSNSCCSHPRSGRQIPEEARERLMAELGFTTELEHIGTRTYKEQLPNGLVEWELDHLFVGRHFSNTRPNPEEVESIRWVGLDSLQKELAVNPSAFTPWLPHILPTFIDWCSENIG